MQHANRQSRYYTTKHLPCWFMVSVAIDDETKGWICKFDGTDAKYYTTSDSQCRQDSKSARTSATIFHMPQQLPSAVHMPYYRPGPTSPTISIFKITSPSPTSEHGNVLLVHYIRGSRWCAEHYIMGTRFDSLSSSSQDRTQTWCRRRIATVGEAAANENQHHHNTEFPGRRHPACPAAAPTRLPGSSKPRDLRSSSTPISPVAAAVVRTRATASSTGAAIMTRKGTGGTTEDQGSVVW